MSALRAAAQAVLDRWDSPQWDWGKCGPTADLIAGLRAALLLRCPHCDGTGDVHDATGEWRGVCVCVAPIDMVLHCPACGAQHIDAADEIDPYPTPEKDAAWWGNPPHRSHLCHDCGHVWRPADVATNGVAAVKTKGSADSPIAVPIATGDPVAWAQLGMFNGRTYVLYTYEREPYPPPADVVRNLNLVPLYAAVTGDRP